MKEAKSKLAKIEAVLETDYEDYVLQKRNDIVEFHLKHNISYREIVGKTAFENWKELPIMTKKDFQKPLSKRISRGFKENVYINKTSGSSGDPFIFGRGGEEVEHLRSHGIEVDVVNGITSGLAAVTSMGVPLTHRTHAHGVIFVTGHATPHKDGVDWSQLAQTAHQSRLTLVIYMGFKACAHIQVGLLNGLPKDTPVLIVQNASLPTQRQKSSQLDQLVDTINKKELQSPCIIVVGDVLKGLATLSSQPPVACENTHLTAT